MSPASPSPTTSSRSSTPKPAPPPPGPNGPYVASGSFDPPPLRDLFADHFDPASRRAENEINEAGEPHPADSPEEYDLRNVRANDLRDRMESHDSRDDRAPRDTRDDATALRLPEHYESTTLGGLVSEIAGHIPLPRDGVAEDGLRLDVLASP